MSLNNILEIAALSAGGISAIMVCHGLLKGRYDSQSAEEFYEDANEKTKSILGKPNLVRIYADSIINAPKYIYLRVANKKYDDALSRYISKANEEED